MRRKRKKKWIEKISSDLWVGNEKKEKEKVSQFQGGFIRAVCSCMARASCLKSILHKCVKKNIFFFFCTQASAITFPDGEQEEGDCFWSWPQMEQPEA